MSVSAARKFFNLPLSVELLPGEEFEFVDWKYKKIRASIAFDIAMKHHKSFKGWVVAKTKGLLELLRVGSLAEKVWSWYNPLFFPYTEGARILCAFQVERRQIIKKKQMLYDILKNQYGIEAPYEVIQEINPLEYSILCTTYPSLDLSHSKADHEQCTTVANRIIEELWLQDQPTYATTYQRLVAFVSFPLTDLESEGRDRVCHDNGRGRRKNCVRVCAFCSARTLFHIYMYSYLNNVIRLDRVAKTFRSKRGITPEAITEVDSQIDSTRAACVDDWLESIMSFSREICSQPAAKKICLAPPPPSLVMRVSPHHLPVISRIVRKKKNKSMVHTHTHIYIPLMCALTKNEIKISRDSERKSEKVATPS